MMVYRSRADLGGTAGQGRVIPEPEGELFHAPWEPQVLSLALAMGATGQWNLDMSRSARETLPDYADLSYYAIWLEALQKLLIERGLVHEDEIESGRALHAPRPVSRVLRGADVSGVLAKGSSTSRPPTAPAAFALGAQVRMRSAPVPHHTRLPGYARGKIGRIEHIHGVHVFPDTNAQGLGEQPQWLYTIAFEAQELWGEDACKGLSVRIDAWEPYLERLA
jgi:nitrile hydratase subunit beta